MQIWQVGNLFGLATCKCPVANKIECIDLPKRDSHKHCNGQSVTNNGLKEETSIATLAV